MSMKDEIYVSVDIETNGTRIGQHSMLSLGAAAFTMEGGEEPVAEFASNIVPLNDVDFPMVSDAPYECETTMQWWKQHPAAYAEATKDPMHAARVMTAFVEWVKGLEGEPVLVAYPLAFDWPFIEYYLSIHGLENPFGRGGIDISTLVMVLQYQGYKESRRHDWPESLTRGIEFGTHRAIDDAIAQGKAFVRIMNHLSWKHIDALAGSGQGA